MASIFPLIKFGLDIPVCKPARMPLKVQSQEGLLLKPKEEGIKILGIRISTGPYEHRSGKQVAMSTPEMV